MNKREQELLDKQLWGVSPKPPRSGGLLGLAIIAVFFTGLASGDILFAQKQDPTRVISHEAMALLPAQLRAIDR